MGSSIIKEKKRELLEYGRQLYNTDGYDKNSLSKEMLSNCQIIQVKAFLLQSWLPSKRSKETIYLKNFMQVRLDSLTFPVFKSAKWDNALNINLSLNRLLLKLICCLLLFLCKQPKRTKFLILEIIHEAITQTPSLFVLW